MPIEPVDPSKKTGGDGQEKYPAKPKHGPGKFDEILEKAEKAQKARDEISKIAGEQREKVKAESPRTYTERLQDMGRLPKPSGAAGAKIELEKGMMGSNIPKPKLKAGVRTAFPVLFLAVLLVLLLRTPVGLGLRLLFLAGIFPPSRTTSSLTWLSTSGLPKPLKNAEILLNHSFISTASRLIFFSYQLRFTS